MKRLSKLKSLIYKGPITGLDLHHDLNLQPDWFNFYILIFSISLNMIKVDGFIFPKCQKEKNSKSP